MNRTIVVALALVLIVSAGELARGQGFYRNTAGRDPVTGRQQIIDLRQPRWSGGGQGGYMWDSGTGSMQLAAVARDRLTGRLEYFNQYMNPWTGARYTTATRFNPYTKRYETYHDFVPPELKTPPAAVPPLAAPVATEDVPKEKPRGLRVIETKKNEQVHPPVENPAQTGVNTVPGGTAQADAKKTPGIRVINVQPATGVRPSPVAPGPGASTNLPGAAQSSDLEVSAPEFEPVAATDATTQSAAVEIRFK